MASIPTKVQARLIAGLKKFQPILNTARIKDVNESDTVVIITDMLSEIFGYDKYSEITSEYAIKKTVCDLALKVDGKIKFLLEIKAIGLTLKDEHVKQAIDYGSNEGVDWVILTNGINWKIFNILFRKPIEQELVYEFDLSNLSHKNEDDLELLYYITKESIGKTALDDYYEQKKTLNCFFIGQLMTTEPVIDCIRKMIRKISPDVKASNEDIEKILIHEVLKREVLEGEKTDNAKKKINKWMRAQQKKDEATQTNDCAGTIPMSDSDNGIKPSETQQI